jgi:ketosteroid isomerase-like protein
MLDAFNRGDFDEVATMLSADTQLLPPGGQSAIRGRERVRAWMEPDAFAEQAVEPLEFTVSGNKVLLWHRTRVRAAASGIEFDWPGWLLWTFGDDGLITHLQIFLEHEREAATAAAGPSGPSSA